MANSREELIKQQREQMPMEQRQVVALEQIADTLARIHGEMVSSRMAPRSGSSSF